MTLDSSMIGMMVIGRRARELWPERIFLLISISPMIIWLKATGKIIVNDPKYDSNIDDTNWECFKLE